MKQIQYLGSVRYGMGKAGQTRILYVIATLDRAGAEGQLVALLTRLDRGRFEPRLVCLTRGGPHEEPLKQANVPYEILGKRRKIDPGFLWRLRRRILQFRPDVLHTWMFTSNAYGRVAAAGAGVPVWIASERAVDSWKTWPYRVTDRLLAAFTERIVGNCQAIRAFLVNEIGIPNRRIEVIPNGVDLNRFPRRELRDAQEITFGTAGRLVPQKRMDLFIRAVAKLREAGIPAKAIIAGDGPLRGELERLASQLLVQQHVTFCGAVEDIVGFLADTDVFVLASDWEGMPNVVLEAMASGLPVVATAVDGSVDLVRDGVTGFLVPRANEEHLAAAMMKLASSAELRRQQGQAARERVEAEFTMERMVERYESLYARLLEERGR